MDNRHIVVLDIGTTTAKAIIFSLSGKEIAIETIPYTFLDKPQGYYEQDPNEVYNAVINSAALAVKSARTNIKEFNPVAISIVCQGGSLIPCDNQGKHLYPMITWMDSRAENVTKRLIDSGEGIKIHAKSGFLPSPGLPLSMIIWIRENAPKLFEKTQKWLCLNDYIIKKLTGEFITNHSSAGLTQLLSIETNDWDDELMKLAGVKREQLSSLAGADECAGKLLKEPADSMGLPVGLPVVNGMHDRTAEAVGLGNYKAGDSWIGTGTAWVVCSVINSEDINGNLTSNYHTMTDKRIASVLIGGIGSSIEWWVKKLIQKNGGTRKEVLKQLDELASCSEIGANGLIFKAFTGTGNEGSFVGEIKEHTDADRTRAIYEAIAFDFKKEYLEFKRNANINGSLTLVGGATRSTKWPKIIAEILGTELEVSVYDHDPALGAAILAGKYLNIADTYEEIYEIFKTEKARILPDKDNVKRYNELFKERY